ncbi:hypothetical protein [Nocardioides sp. S5]|uniref:hypothetical protein n=1 Tax=Nocardioides sp. S5 TaxID=2017486 RepID=UPI001A8F41C3|nr:hypothetical protein [Nocardioides sp. S5]
MSPAYDGRVEHVDTHLAQAEASAQHVPGQSQRDVEFPAWLRIQHWSRLAHSQQHHLHWWYLQTDSAAVCTCGLVHRLPPPLVLNVTGHRDPETWRLTRLLIVHALPDASSTAVGRARTHSGWRLPSYQVGCQACDCRSARISLQDAVDVRSAHASTCTATGAL